MNIDTMNRAQRIQALVECLVCPDTQDRDLFAYLIKESQALFVPLDDHALARKFGVTRSTVTLWRDGAVAPHPAMRRPIYVELYNMILAYQLVE